ncbi:MULTISPECIES: M3 family metallopeptidase [unclassified Sphingobium]|uniref:M3 family metallopeptidase n=1 Tax=unclassified Sphingobium TaxID=2611147 RepID=UPI00222497B6|nr:MULTISPECIES: M3 family metallopeptidase [unclassified Sphingobium]MCW2382648.1 peptidyl-dipeptidase Dcp [Sphingobium sp. B2D3B]MCW2397179.1 peptidyl-dipeptidase Dcp [Sphingobium sp. B2D3C]
MSAVALALSTPLAAQKAETITAPWTGPYGGVPAWDKVDPAAFPAAFEAVMASVKAQFEGVLANKAAPTFDNTITALQKETLSDRVMPIWGVYVSNLSNDDIRRIQGEWSPKLSAFFNELTLDPRYFARVKALYDKRETLGLDAKQMRLLTRTYEDLVANGAMLDAAQKKELIGIETALAQEFSSFQNKVLADEEKFITFTSEADLAGLPADFVATMKSVAQDKGVNGWLLINTRSYVQPFLESSTRRDLRKSVFEAFANRGDNGDANDTNATIARIVALRAQRAKLLGFKTHAEYRMRDTMAQTPDKAMALMMKVWPAAVARVREEVADMQAIADAEAKAGQGPKITIEPWDYRFYAEKVRKAKYDLDQNEVKPYFQLDKMVSAMFDMANRLYGFTFTENTGAVPVFHPDVRTFEVTRGGKVVGLFYLDTWARSGKRSGAWMTTYKGQDHLNGNEYVLASNNNNFAKGSAGVPTTISLDDATTLFHEFGHALHYLSYDITWPGLGTTPRDFVEYPSQVHENWVLTPYILETYARHFQTGAPIPKALVDKIKASDTFNQGFATVEYLSSAIVDMKLHNRPDAPTDIDAFERETLAEIGMPKEMIMRHRLPQFNHLFSSDAYSAGYYSYLWSETMDADSWAAFEETGNVWDPALAARFNKALLSTGNETDRAEAYRAFRGRDPDVNALLRKRGFPVPAQ